MAAGLDYVGVSPILAGLHESGRVRFEAATDDAVVEASRRLRDAEAPRSTSRLAGQGYFEWQSRVDLHLETPFDEVADALRADARDGA